MTAQAPVVNRDAPVKRRRIGELLVSKGVVSDDQVRIALTEQKKSKEHLGKILVRLGFATEAVIRDVLGGALGYDTVDLTKVVVDADVVKLIPKDVARRYHMLAITYSGEAGVVTVAMADPYNVIALDQVRAQLGGELEVRALIAGEAEINKAIDQFYGFELSVDGILQEIETGEVDYQSLEAESDEYSQPVVRLVNALLSDAVKRGASDIHFEPEHDFLRIRYRVDGVLRQIRSLHRNYWAAIAVRLKVMAGMNIAEMRAPQDGRISLSVSGREVDFRVSSLPTTYGENIVLRVLDRQKGIVPLEGLGLSENALATLRLMMARPEGIILVTGPTGSGKTTTLYSMLNHLNSETVNIMTLEDPVEYPLEMIRLVGEIRDEETAEMAFRAAMTGHQVFTTLHTNSAIGAIPRLLETGVIPDIMAGNIIGVIGQRLVRKLCVHCKEVYEPSMLERQILNLGGGSEAPPIYRASGCKRCEHSGFKGRLALTELLRFDGEIDELVARRVTQREILKLARNKGYTTLAEDGVRRVLEGVTSMEEISRVMNLTEGIS